VRSISIAAFGALVSMVPTYALMSVASYTFLVSATMPSTTLWNWPNAPSVDQALFERYLSSVMKIWRNWSSVIAWHFGSSGLLVFRRFCASS
jgi:hypothetical protein